MKNTCPLYIVDQVLKVLLVKFYDKATNSFYFYCFATFQDFIQLEKRFLSQVFFLDPLKPPTLITAQIY